MSDMQRTGARDTALEVLMQVSRANAWSDGSLKRTIAKNRLDSREAELSDLFTEDAAYIESWGPEYYGREMIARWFRDWHRSGQVLRWDIQEFLNYENTTVVRWYFQCQISGEAPTGFDGLSLIRWSVDGKIAFLQEYACTEKRYCPYG